MRLARADLLVGLGLLVVAFFLRVSALALPHDSGDQVIWAGVARNIEARGLAGYTVRGLSPRYEPRGGGAALLRFDPTEGKGPLLEGFIQSGERYWDAPLVNQPPGFFLVLLASHALAGGRDDGFPVVAADPGAKAARMQELWAASHDGYARRLREIATLPEAEREQARAELEAPLSEAQWAWSRGLATSLVSRPSARLVRAQLWATLPVLVSELGTTGVLFLMTLLLARRGGLEPGPARLAAALAAIAYATDPIALYCAHRLLSNAPVAFASCATLALEVLSLTRKREERAGLSILTGVAAGLAISIKVSAVFLLPAIVLGRVLRGEWRERSLAFLLAAALLLAAPWWLLQWHVLGHPFGFAWRNQPDRVLVSPWGALVTHRGAGYYLRSLARSPFVLLGGIASLRALVHAARKWRQGSPEAGTFVGPLFALAVIAAAVRFEEKEARHLLLAYPPLLALAAITFVRAVRGRRAGLLLGALAATALAWQASSGIGLALDTAVPP